MANETTLTTVDDLNYAAIIEEVVKAELGARVVIAPFARTKSLEGMASLAWKVPKWTALSTGVDAVAEATDLANEAVSSGSATVTAGEVGGMSTVTDKLVVAAVTQEDTLVQIGQVWGRSLARKIDVDLATLFGAFNGGTSVGTTTADMNEDDFLTALYTLEVANAVGPKVCVLHPRQAADLRTDMFINAVTTTGGMPGHVATLDHNAFGFSNDESGYWATLFGVPVYITTACPLVNTNADRGGAMFIAGSALGLAYKWMPKVELQRDASLRATEVVVTACYGVAEIEDGEGVPIETDA